MASGQITAHCRTDKFTLEATKALTQIIIGVDWLSLTFGKHPLTNRNVWLCPSIRNTLPRTSHYIFVGQDLRIVTDPYHH